MTKEECKQALETVLDYWKDGSPDGVVKCDEVYEIIERLIKEHFDNPPLKFEELKPGMWVWENECKVFVKIYNTFMDDGKEMVCFRYAGTGLKLRFRENRFYRRQKESEDNA